MRRGDLRRTAGDMNDYRTEADRAREPKSAPPLTLSRVKAVAQQDESIGRMGMDATYLIGRCTDAFLADLVKASADRASAAGHRKPDRSIKKRTSKTATQQVLPEDVVKAVADEERFDFLRPVLSPPQENGRSLNAAGAKGKRKKRAPTSGGAGTGGGGARKGKKRMEMESAGVAAAAAASGAANVVSDLLASGGPIAPNAEARGGGLLALEGLDDEGRRRALLGGLDTGPSAACGLGDDDEEDYDNY